MDELEKICVICQKVCKISHKCICCAVCNKWIHLKCSKLTIKPGLHNSKIARATLTTENLPRAA